LQIDGLAIGDWRLAIGDCGSTDRRLRNCQCPNQQSVDRQSAIGNPSIANLQSAIRRSAVCNLQSAMD
jgi:hypothetical protein